MDALIISTGQDTGGQSIRWKQAADHQRVTAGLRIRAVTATVTYAYYPVDVRLAGNGAAIRRLWLWADIIHLNNRDVAYTKFDRGAHKPVLLHHHGTIFRNAHRQLMSLAAHHRWPQAVSTLDLVDYDPAVLHWLPTVYDLDGLAAIAAAADRPSGRPIRVASAPTFREGKGTGYLIAAVDRLRSEGLDVELDLIEQVSNAEVIQRKALADIYFDQVSAAPQWPGGYGNNAVEAWGVGLPVIAGARAGTLRRMRREFGGELPFAKATTRTLTSVLRELVVSADARAEWAARGLAHARRFHDEIPALDRLLSLYEMAKRRQVSYGTVSVA